MWRKVKALAGPKVLMFCMQVVHCLKMHIFTCKNCCILQVVMGFMQLNIKRLYNSCSYFLSTAIHRFLCDS
ncbi:hypothetical protein KP509_15G047700 [Ceratopteris richardii]|uniref:Secreted protein n=1 Tax=Ceratopteris richardii TaxID=49495 RepID=A0A8T2T430_CERRI|nr:hypothetical protein KP509_15G047700 [Ceratopteris richardii]